MGTMMIFLVVLEMIIAACAQLLLRYGAMQLQDRSLDLSIVLEPFRNIYIFSGLSLHALSFFLYIYILSKLNLNIVYPIATGGSIVVISLLAAFFLKERMNVLQVVGVFTIIAGIMLVLLPGQKAQAHPAASAEAAVVDQK
jgi:small multidrug resistance pump